MFKKSAAIGTTLAIGLSGVVVAAAPPASAATYYVCKNKKTGKVKPAKKNTKCKKGWKKVKFSGAG